VANGYAALYNHTNGSFNTAIGVAALYSDINGVQNTAIGGNALDQNRSGYGNTAIGQSALYYSTGNYNTALGDGAGTGVTTASNVIAIGEAGADVSNSCFIANIRGITTQHNDAMPV
jgi:trimeric autotransporter adhesin